MAVDSIGAILGTPDSGSLRQKTINQEDFIKLFVSQLQFQDPMQPMDNSQFLLQLAQFESIELSSQTNGGIQDLLSMDASSQSMGLLNHEVQVAGAGGATVSGKVSAIQFTQAGVQLSVTEDTSGTVLTGVRLSQINLVRP